MSDKKISQLGVAAPLTGTEPIPTVQGGVTVKTTAQDIANLAPAPIIIPGAGANSTIRCGVGNLASGNCSSALSGCGNNASQSFATIVGGKDNTASGYYAFTGSGYCNTTSAYYAFTGSGRCNITSGNHAFTGSGNSNTTSGWFSFTGSGCKNLTQAVAGVVVGGICNNVCNVTSGCLALGAVVGGGCGLSFHPGCHMIGWCVIY